nr:hypothetical protein [Tanacetum cinerariifolium]
MIENHSKDRLVKEVLMMVLVIHTEEDDTVLHIEKTGMLILVVEIDFGGMTVDVVDKLNCSSDDIQPRQLDLRTMSSPNHLTSNIEDAFSEYILLWRGVRDGVVVGMAAAVGRVGGGKVTMVEMVDRVKMVMMDLWLRRSVELAWCGGRSS